MAFGQPPTTISWRADKDKDTGEQRGWKLMGPTHLLRVGQVTVTKRDGSLQTVLVGRISKAFMVDGVECCFGWPAQNDDEGQAALAAQNAQITASQPAPAAPVVEADPWQTALAQQPGGDWVAPTV